MSLITKSLKEAGLTMQADALPKKDRTVKAFQRLIAAMRAAESEVEDRIGAAEASLNDSLRTNLELQERCHQLENLVRQHKIAEKLASIESLSSADRQLLLEVDADLVSVQAA